ncbi:MAG: hypothetical protein RL215_519 [Planctomycetota bacterium]|jgi:hypothetical protein
MLVPVFPWRMGAVVRRLEVPGEFERLCGGIWREGTAGTGGGCGADCGVL